MLNDMEKLLKQNEELALEETLDGLPKLPPALQVDFSFVKWSPRDYIMGTFGMNFDVEGAYSRFLNRLYSRGCGLPDDNAFIARAMNCDVRVWKRMRATLTDMGKIEVRDGLLTNSRFERERHKFYYHREFKGRTCIKERPSASVKTVAARAKVQGEKQQEVAASAQKEQAPNPTSMGTSAGLQPDLGAHLFENGNENNHLGIESKNYKNSKNNNPPIVPPSGGTSKKSGRKKSAGERLSEDWVLPDEWRDETRESTRVPNEQLLREAVKFKRYWTGPDAKSPMKKDWKRTWQNWVDNQVDRGFLRPVAKPDDAEKAKIEARNRRAEEAWVAQQANLARQKKFLEEREAEKKRAESQQVDAWNF